MQAIEKIKNFLKKKQDSNNEYIIINKEYSLRYFKKNDLDNLHNIYNLPEVAIWLPASMATGKILDTTAILFRYENNNELPHDINFAIVDKNDQLIGCVSFENYQSIDHSYEIAFEMHTAYQGKGITKQAVLKSVQFLFEKYNIKKIMAFTLTNNFPSQRLLKSCNFKEEYQDNMKYFRGQMHKVKTFTLNNC